MKAPRFLLLLVLPVLAGCSDRAKPAAADAETIAKSVEGTAWNVTVECGGKIRKATYLLEAGGMKATNAFACKEDTGERCTPCEPLLETCGTKLEAGFIGRLERVTGDIREKGAGFRILRGATEGAATLYLPGDDGGWRCELAMMPSVQPCVKTTSWDKTANAFDKPALGNCDATVTGVGKRTR